MAFLLQLVILTLHHFVKNGPGYSGCQNEEKNKKHIKAEVIKQLKHYKKRE